MSSVSRLAAGLPVRIASQLGMVSGLAFSRGSAALYALLAVLAESHGPGEVIVPALCCESVALAAIYAGHGVVFADVSPASLCMTPETVEPLVSERTRAVLVVHLYGIDAKIEGFAALRAAHPSVAFIEDVAHGLGGRGRDGKLLGGGLDYALLSFADSKIVPGDGGMLLFSGKVPDGTAERVAAATPAGAPRTPSAALALSLRNLVHGLADLKREHVAAGTAAAFTAVASGYRDLIVCAGGIADETAVMEGAGRLDAIRAVRYGHYAMYRDGISTPHATVVPLHDGCTCWRCPVLFDEPDRARRTTRALRSAGIHASNHYFPLNLLLGNEAKPVSEYVSARIVNLWTDEQATASMVERTVKIINSC